MKTKKFISVIIPTYNCKAYVKYTIESVLKQTYRNFELIIIDDCSTDGTYEYVSKLIKNISVKAIILQTKKNSGTVAHPRNIGVKKSKGDLICFLDSDDIWEKNKLAIQVEEYVNDKTIHFTAAKYFNQNGFKSNIVINLLRKFFQQFVITRVNKTDYHWFYLYNPVIVSSVLINKKILINNTFDENINSREDYDLWIRLRKKKI